MWRKAHELALVSYRVTESVSYRRYPGLADQLRRAVFSIPTNVAEGSGRDTAVQFAHFLEIAIASAREVDYLLLLAADLDAISRSDHAKLEARTDEVCRMLVSLRATIRKRAFLRSELSRGDKLPRKGEKKVSATKSR